MKQNILQKEGEQSRSTHQIDRPCEGWRGGSVIGSTQSLIRRPPEDGSGRVEEGKNARPHDDKKTLMLIKQI